MWYWILIPIGLYVVLRGVGRAYGEAVVMPKVFDQLRWQKEQAAKGNKNAIKKWKKSSMALHEMVLQARRGNPEHVKIVNQLLTQGLLDENILRN